MIEQIAGLVSTPLFCASLVLWLSSCTQIGAALRNDAGSSSGADVGTARPGLRRIAQVLIDGRPTYAICQEPACPAVTPKLLPSVLSMVPQRPGSDQARSGEEGDAAIQIAAQPPVQAVQARDAAMPAEPIDGSRLDATQTEPVFFDRKAAVSFAVNSALLTAKAKLELDRALPWARQADRIVISGRTDNLGGDSLNRRLAFARALAVREYIRGQVPLGDNVITIDARGACCFVASNSTREGRSRNRRVEVVFHGARSQVAS